MKLFFNNYNILLCLRKFSGQDTICRKIDLNQPDGGFIEDAEKDLTP